jgi:NDP-sugar pyrophosphorylase family protein
MIGAILTGGYGRRMQGISSNLPKNFLPLRDDYLILDRQLRDFRVAGIGKVYLLTGFKGEIIEKRYGKKWKDTEIEYLKEEVPMGTLWSLRNLFNHTQEDVVLRNGDTVCDLDIRDLIGFHKRKGKKATMLVVKMISPYGIVTMKGDSVTSFVEKPILNHYINAGLYYLDRETNQYLSDDFTGKDLETTVFRRMAQEGEISALKYHGLWKSVDSLKDYEEIRYLYSRREDYDFGFVEYDGSRRIYTILKEKSVVFDGRGTIELLRGSIMVDGTLQKVGKEVEVRGVVPIQSLNESSIEVSGEIGVKSA